MNSNCPCCAGRKDGDWEQLCDVCLDAAMAGRFPHGCKREAAVPA